MKKAYETPTIEKIAFNYRDQVVAASGSNPEELAQNKTTWSSCFWNHGVEGWGQSWCADIPFLG